MVLREKFEKRCRPIKTGFYDNNFHLLSLALSVPNHNTDVGKT